MGLTNEDRELAFTPAYELVETIRRKKQCKLRGKQKQLSVEE